MIRPGVQTVVNMLRDLTLSYEETEELRSQIALRARDTRSVVVPTREEQLADWWTAAARREIDATVSKAVEYSGTLGGLPQDLVDGGRQIAFVQRREHEFSDAELAEIGVWTYIVGKVNRWSSALRNGRMVSDDTLKDIGVYVRIAQRIRETGQWP